MSLCVKRVWVKKLDKSKKFADQKDVKNLTAIQVSNIKVALNYS